MNNEQRKKFWDILYSLNASNTSENIGKLVSSITYPQNIYRYRTVSEKSLEALQSNKLFFSTSNYYDDPFDTFLHINENLISYSADLLIQNKNNVDLILDIFGFPVEVKEQIYKIIDTSSPEAKKIIEAMKKARNTIRANIYSICFSQNAFNENLWLKYANNHKGFVLRFNPNNNNFLCGKQAECDNCAMKQTHFPMYPVYYSDTKYDATGLALAEALLNTHTDKLPDGFLVILKKMLEEFLPWQKEKCILIKKKCHEYDEEWRMILSCNTQPNPCIKWKPESVIIGLKTPEYERKLIIAASQTAGIADILQIYINDDDNLMVKPI